VQRTALRQGLPDSSLEAAQRSPVYRFVKEWKLALPPHVEFRTLPMLFYVPPMSPVLAARHGKALEHVSDELFHDIEQARVPIKFLANLLAGGNEEKVRYALRKQKAVRWYRRALTVGDVDRAKAEQMLREADCSVEEAEAIFRMTAIAPADERFVIPPAQRELAAELLEGDAMDRKRAVGFGFLSGPERGL
jgi:nitrate reductase beta subunit